MFATPAFPRIPLFGGEARSTRRYECEFYAESPPVVPFDTLVLSVEKMKSETTETYKSANATSIAKY